MYLKQVMHSRTFD